MITEIEIEGFKSLKKVDLKLGKLNLFVGANASGKSNFFDALRVLQGIGYGFSIDEILNGKPKSAGSEVWEPIRGGAARAAFSGRSGLTKNGITLSVKLNTHAISPLSYSIWFLPIPGTVESEELIAQGEPVYERELGGLSLDRDPTGSTDLRGLSPRVPALALDRLGVLRNGDHYKVEACARALSNMQRIDPAPDRLREYSQSGFVRRLGERGESFAALVRTILSVEMAREAYVSWLKELTPSELDDVTILEGALGEPLFAIKKNGDIVPAPVLSDGTLRFAAIAAAFFQLDMPDIIMLEEIENGLHPSRLRLLVELLKSLSGGPDCLSPQVFATTHSPLVLSWLEESDYATTFVCKRDEETGASIIKPLSEIPLLVELAKKQPIGELFAEGWLEAAP